MAMTFPYCNTTNDLQEVYKDIEKFSGVDTISTFTLTSGNESTYDKRATGFVDIVYEDGVPLTEQTSIANVESNSGSFYYDSTNDILYVHSTDDEDPDTHTITVAVEDWPTFKTKMANAAHQQLENLLDPEYPRPLPFAMSQYNSLNYDEDIRICAALLTCINIMRHRDPNHPDIKVLQDQVWNAEEERGILWEYRKGLRSFSFETTKDQFDGNKLDSEKWAVRGVGPRAAGYVSPDAVKINNGFLELSAFVENDSIKTGAVGTQGLFMTTYGYFECRAQLQKSAGNWAAFWIQSPGIAQGEDPAKFGTEIDIFEYFKKQGEDMISHNLHWAYGPNQKTIGGLLSNVEGVGQGFHTFALEWTPDKYAFFVDGYKYYEVTEAISHIDEYIILSMELPSTKEVLKDADLPDVFIINYVKVYKKK